MVFSIYGNTVWQQLHYQRPGIVFVRKYSFVTHKQVFSMSGNTALSHRPVT